MSNVSIGGLVIILMIIGYLVINGLSQVKESLPEALKETITGKAPLETATITYQNNAFSPASVRIKVGESVKFVNNHTFAIRVPSNPHPVHTSYPKLESGTIDPGNSYTFTAIEKATIKYHNHFNPGVGGEIIVE